MKRPPTQWKLHQKTLIKQGIEKIFVKKLKDIYKNSAATIK